MFMMTELFLARRYLFRGKARHISFIGVISCLGVALGVGTLIVVISVMNGFDRDLTERLLRFSYHVNVESLQPQKLDEVRDAVRQWPQVKDAGLYLETQVFVQFNDKVLPCAVRGIDYSDPVQKQRFSKYVTEDFGQPGFYAGIGVARRLGHAKTLEFYPLEKAMRGRQDHISGYFKVGMYDVDNNYLVTDIDRARDLSDNYLEYVGIQLNDPYLAGQVKEKITAQFGQAVLPLTWTETNQALFSALKLEKIMMFIILSLIILVATFNILATLTVRVVEKTKDIGILRSVGYSRNQILAIFSWQGLFLGLIGTLSGLTLGSGICWALARYQFVRLPAEIYYLDYLPVHMDYADMGLIALVGLILALISSILPAIQAAKMETCEALRYE